MEAAPEKITLKYQSWLPYWAVLQTDFRQTIRSWVYRVWVMVCFISILVYLFYRFGIHSESWLIQSASLHTSFVIRGVLLGSLALVVILSVSAIAGERGTLADSVLSRGINRYQYFLAKWHARSFVVILTLIFLSGTMLLGSSLLLGEDLTFHGSLIALWTISVTILGVCAWGTSLGALTNSSILGITILWIILYGGSSLFTLLPESFPAPERIFAKMPGILKGEYGWEQVSPWTNFVLVTSAISIILGIWGFNRKDI